MLVRGSSRPKIALVEGWIAMGHGIWDMGHGIWVCDSGGRWKDGYGMDG